MDPLREIKKRTLHLIKRGFQCGMGTELSTYTFTNRSQQYSFVLSWMLRCEGTFTENGRIYPLHNGCVCMRRPDRDYLLHFSDSDGLRLYLQFPQSFYPALLWMVPELEQMEPVWDCPYCDTYFEEFLAIYDRIAALSHLELYTIFPQIVQYILRITGIQKQRTDNPLLRGRVLLEEGTPLPLTDVAERCGMNYNTFRKQFTKEFAVSPHQYRIRCRIRLSKQLLESGLSVSDTAAQLGYPDVYSFTHQFTSVMGVSPSEFRK
ncbi:MAG: helix-turn-helix domain-containing protein [Eubacteriales bacterium]